MIASNFKVLHEIVRYLGEDDFKYLSQDFDSKRIDLGKKKGFCSNEIMSDFGKFKEELLSKENFYRLLTGKN